MAAEGFKHYFQEVDYDCGAGIVGTALFNKGYPEIDHYSLIEMLRTNLRDGTDISMLCHFFSFLPELEARWNLGCSIEDLQLLISQGRYCIVAYQNWGEEIDKNLEWGHYAFVLEVNGNKIRIFDPDPDDGGEYYMEKDEFEKRWIDREGETIFEKWMMSLKLD